MRDGDGSEAVAETRLATQAVVDEAVRDPKRLEALRATGLLDSAPDEAVDRITRLATELLGAPVALVSLVDIDRQFFKSSTGLGEPWASHRETPLSHSICAQVVAIDGPVVIENTLAAPELRGNLAPGELSAAAYAGVPLRAPDGSVMGAFCVIDDQPRQWSVEQIEIIEVLGTAALQEVELRREVQLARTRDPITGLPNAREFCRMIDLALGRGVTTSSTLVLDVLELRAVVESQGESAGHRLLVAIALRLGNAALSAVFSRTGDDQFSAFVEVSSIREVFAFVDRLRACFHTPFEIGGEQILLSPNIGIAIGNPGDSADELLDGARVALRQAQGAPGHLWLIGAEDVRSRALERLRLENGLRQALTDRTLSVAYQPQVMLASGRLVGFEALVRWKRRPGEFVPPAVFVPLAEEAGFVGAIGEFVLGEACRQIMLWRSLDHCQNLSVSVNISAKQIEDGDLTSMVTRARDRAEAPPGTLRLELTETALIADTTRTAEVLNSVTALGVAIELDDFGTGYSSLAQLSSLPVRALKIDRAFVSDIHDARNGAIVDSILALARALAIETVAEGIETEAQLAQLVAKGCQLGQGYLFARPQPAEEIDRQLAEGRWSVAAARTI